MELTYFLDARTHSHSMLLKANECASNRKKRNLISHWKIVPWISWKYNKTIQIYIYMHTDTLSIINFRVEQVRAKKVLIFFFTCEREARKKRRFPDALICKRMCIIISIKNVDGIYSHTYFDVHTRTHKQYSTLTSQIAKSK